MPSPVPETRASLIMRLPNAADVDAWDEFVRVYGPVVYRLSRRRGLQPADADDLVQDVFSAVAAHVGDWLKRQPRGRFQAWLFTIARNTTINFLTRNHNHGAAVGGDSAAERLAQQPDRLDPLSDQIETEYRREVFRAACELVRPTVADSTWQAFWLTTIDNRLASEVAQQLGLSVGSVYIARCRVMARLRQHAKQFDNAIN